MGRMEGEGRPSNVRDALTPLLPPPLDYVKHKKTFFGLEKYSLTFLDIVTVLTLEKTLPPPKPLYSGMIV